MRAWKYVGIASLVVAILAAGCAPAPTRGDAPSSDAVQPSAPKRVVTAMRGVPKFMVSPLNSTAGGRIDGHSELNGLVSAGLSVSDGNGQRVPLLAEAVPSVDNGMWRVLPDGRMETSWRIRESATWHDGTPITAEDYVFTARLDQDREMPWTVNRIYRYTSGVEAPDARTVKVSWKEAYIRANEVAFATPFPRHVLEEPYTRGEKANIATLPYWNTEYVGTGPFRVKEWVTDSHVVLIANDRWVLGRPKIDELEVKFIPDDNTLAANLLAGTVHFSLGPGLSIEQGIQIRDRWTEGTLLPGPSGDIKMNTQFLNPDPPMLANVQFRRALYMAIDRQQLMDTLVYGLSKVLDSTISPFEPEYPHVEPFIVKYPYDPRKSTQMIEELGYRKGSDGMFADAAGRPLTVQIMATRDDANAKPQVAVLDMWKQIGITPDLEAVSQQRQADLEYRANFKSFSLQSGRGFGPDGLNALLTSEMRIAEKNYLGDNYMRYSNPEIDALVNRYFTTIPFNDRMQILSRVINHATDQLLWQPLYLRVLATLVSNRLTNINPVGEGTNQWANAHHWDAKP